LVARPVARFVTCLVTCVGVWEAQTRFPGSLPGRLQAHKRRLGRSVVVNAGVHVDAEYALEALERPLLMARGPRARAHSQHPTVPSGAVVFSGLRAYWIATTRFRPPAFAL
jgi:hypothetical protein